MAKAFGWPMLVAGILIIAVSAGLYFANKPRITQFEVAYHADAKAFVQTEIQRTAKSQNDLALVFKVCFHLLLLQPHLYGRVCKYAFVASYWHYYNSIDDCFDVY